MLHLCHRFSFIFAFAVLIATSYSCRPKLDLAQRKPMLQAKEAQMLFRKFDEKPLTFRWITGKIDSKATFKGKEQEFTTRFRIQQDSLIWLSMAAPLGIEVARVNITPDSVTFINYFEKTYFLGELDYLQKFLKIEELDLKFVQNILLGEPVLLEAEERWKGEIDSSYYILKNVPGKKLRKALGITRDEDFDIPADSLYLYTSIDRKLGKVLRKNKENDRFLKRYFLDDQFRLVKMLITDVINNRLIEIKYSDFGQIDSLTLPQHVVVDIIDSKESNHIDLVYTKMKTEDSSPVLTKIPEKYVPIKP
ncbi:MAG: DUF4292 domain-containing protein [Bacteroidota bacterium]